MSTWQATVARRARLNLYAADMKLAQLALSENDLGRTVEFLQKDKPDPGEPDYRGFEWRHLWQQSQGQEIASLDVTNSVRALAFSPDGHILVTLGLDDMRIWDVSDLRRNGPGATLRTLEFPEVASVSALTLSEDGRQLAVSTVLRQLIVWDTSTGARLATHRELAGHINSLQYRASGDRTAAVKLWVTPVLGVASIAMGMAKMSCQAT